MIFQVGDIVRLNAGWTAMVVLGFNSKGQIFAQYCEERHIRWNPITQDNYDNPEDYKDYCRMPKGFVLWDGEPLKHKVYKPMPSKYKVINHSTQYDGLTGTYLSRTLDGSRFVLQFPSGKIKDFGTDQLIEDIPYTFLVRSMNTPNRHYTCTYALEDNQSVSVGDILLSDSDNISGNIFRVETLNTKEKNHKGIFKGHRLIKEPL